MNSRELYSSRGESNDTTDYSRELWNDKQQSNTKLRNMRKPVINQIFEDASNYTEDPFWINKLQRAARGYFPKGFTYIGNNLCHLEKNKYTKVNVPHVHSLACKTFIEFLNQQKGIVSDTDLERLDKDLGSMKIESNKQIDWSKLSAKAKKNSIEQFILKITSEKSLDRYQSSNLKNIINIGLKSKIINAKTIVIVNAEITSIDGLIYDETLKKFYMSHKLKQTKKTNVKNNHINEKHPMYLPITQSIPKHWEFVLEHYEKIRSCDGKFSVKDDDEDDDGPIIIFED